MEDDIQKLLEENLALTRQVKGMVEKIQRHIFWQRIVGLIYLFLIIAPLIVAAIYLPPLLGDVIGQYQDLLKGGL